jgi:lysophospholipase L1-like esterase
MLLQHLQDSLHHVADSAPDVVILDIGGNDIDYGRAPVHAMVNQLFVFCRLLLTSYGVKVVVILEVPFRSRVCRGSWSSVSRMNIAIHRFNVMCQSRCRSNPGQRIRFHHHVGLLDNWQQYLKSDGVHFNPTGMSKYFRSVRTAAIRFSSLARVL